MRIDLSTNESQPMWVAKALVVDDLPDARRIVGERLRRVGFDLRYAQDGLSALGIFGKTQPDLVVTDQQMPRLDGIGLVRRLRKISEVPVVMITAFASIADCEEAMRVGANRYLQFRRDLDRIGPVACDLVRGLAPDLGSLPHESMTGMAAMTAMEARKRAQQEFRRVLQTNLVECRGNVAEMARRMGKDRSTIRYHLCRFGMLGENVGTSARSEWDVAFEEPD